MDSIWTEPVFSDLCIFAKLEISATMIAHRLADKHGITVTRSAVIGKAFRENVPLNGPNGRRIRPRMSPEERNERRRDHWLADRLKRQQRKLQLRQEAIAEAVPVVDDLIPTKQRKRLLDLTEKDCRWPVGEPGTREFFFCGGEAIQGLSYCAYHWRIGHTYQRAAPERPDARRRVAKLFCAAVQVIARNMDREDGAAA